MSVSGAKINDMPRARGPGHADQDWWRGIRRTGPTMQNLQTFWQSVHGVGLG